MLELSFLQTEIYSCSSQPRTIFIGLRKSLKTPAYLSEGKTLLKIQGWVRQGNGILDFNALLALFTNPSVYRIS